MILFIVELFADVHCFDFYIKPSSRLIIYNVYSELDSILT